MARRPGEWPGDRRGSADLGRPDQLSIDVARGEFTLGLRGGISRSVRLTTGAALAGSTFWELV